MSTPHPTEAKEASNSVAPTVAPKKFHIEPSLMQEIQTQLRGVVESARFVQDDHRFYLKSILKDQKAQPLVDDLFASIIKEMKELNLGLSSADFSVALDRAINEGIAHYETKNDFTLSQPATQPANLTKDLINRIKRENVDKKSVLDKLYQAFCTQSNSPNVTAQSAVPSPSAALVLHYTAERKSDEVLLQMSRIAEDVVTVCCFGSSNKSAPKKVESALNHLMEIPLVAYQQLCRQAQGTSQNVAGKKLKSFAPDLQELGIFGIPYEKINDYFRFNPQSETIVVNPIALPILFSTIRQQVLPHYDVDEAAPFLKSMTTIAQDPKSLEKCMSPITYNWTKDVKNRAAFHDGGMEKVIPIGADFILDKRQEPKTPTDRETVMRYITHDIKWSAYIHGIGNCQVMAECGFLLAIQKIKAPIRYIQFRDKKEENEELNAFVVGPWPKPGCKISAPWQDTKPIIWQGELSKTPELQQYDQVHVLFTIETEDERQHWSKKLDEWNFNHEKLLVHSNRTSTFEFIKNITGKICAALAEPIPEPEKTAGKKKAKQGKK